MSSKKFLKSLTANDVGATGAHMAGIHIPKSASELFEFLPSLNRDELNPSAWINCVDETGFEWNFRFVYYNNKLHTPKGTRDEYRITHMTKFLRSEGAQEGDFFEISNSEENFLRYHIKIVRRAKLDLDGVEGPVRVKLGAWRRIH